MPKAARKPECVVPYTNHSAALVIVTASMLVAGAVLGQAFRHFSTGGTVSAPPGARIFSIAFGTGTGLALAAVCSAAFILVAVALRFPAPATLAVALSLIPWTEDWFEGYYFFGLWWGVLPMTFASLVRSRRLSLSLDAATHACAAASGWLAGISAWMFSVATLSARGSDYVALVPASGALAAGLISVFTQRRLASWLDRVQRGRVAGWAMKPRPAAPQVNQALSEREQWLLSVPLVTKSNDVKHVLTLQGVAPDGGQTTAALIEADAIRRWWRGLLPSFNTGLTRAAMFTIYSVVVGVIAYGHAWSSIRR